jgi:hypothetical protein
MKTVTRPTYWRVTLRSGAVILVLADGYSEEQGSHRFSILVDTSDDEQKGLLIDGVTPANASRVIVRIVDIPSTEVAEVGSD